MADKIQYEMSSDHLEAGQSSGEKPTVLDFDDDMVQNEERAPEARGFHENQLSKVYWTSPTFLGSYFAAALTFTASVGGYAQTAPLLSYINEDIGPSELIHYVPLANVVASAAALQVIGCLSDIFGRRWFFIAGSYVALLAAILGATARSITQIVICQAFFGVAKGFGLSFFWVISELVPMRWRLLAVSGVYLISMPGNPLAAKIALEFQFSTAVHWRGCYYLLTGLSAVNVLLWYFFYHPPTFKMLHRRKRATETALQFDWIGLIIYSTSLIVFILGLSWGGSLYPWKSGHVIGSILGGAAGFAVFAVWEIFLPLPNVQPLLPMHLFKNARFQACCWSTGIGALTYYGFSLVWPQAVKTLYDNVSRDQQSTLTTSLILCFVLGQFSGGVIAEYASVRISAISSAVAALPLLIGAATNPRNLNLTIGLAATGCFMVGANEGVALTAATFSIKSQEELGAAGGLAGTIRQFCASIGTAVFSTILSNQLSDKIPRYVGEAVVEAGLPRASLPALLASVGNLTAVTNETVPGFSPQIASVAKEALKNAQASSYSTVIYSSAAFAGVLLLLCWWIPGFDPKKSNFVAGHLHQTNEQKKLEQE